ncbi:hypothetical protein HPP92_018335 [Vanilla planifolia]|nr:hypothetical protein HPP92_018335 [Vanilla planifolia]
MAANSSVQVTAMETSALSTEPQPWKTVDQDHEAMPVPNDVVGLSLSTNGDTRST